MNIGNNVSKDMISSESQWTPRKRKGVHFSKMLKNFSDSLMVVTSPF